MNGQLYNGRNLCTNFETSFYAKKIESGIKYLCFYDPFTQAENTENRKKLRQTDKADSFVSGYKFSYILCLF